MTRAPAFAAISLLTEVHRLGSMIYHAGHLQAQHNADQIASLKADVAAVIDQLTSLSQQQLNTLTIHIAQDENRIIDVINTAATTFGLYIAQCNKPTSAFMYRLWRHWYDAEYACIKERVSNVALLIRRARQNISAAGLYAAPSVSLCAMFVADIPPTHLVSVGRCLGRGNFGDVDVMTSIADERQVAVKNYELRSASSVSVLSSLDAAAQRALFINEARLVHALAQSNDRIVNVIGVMMPPTSVVSVGLVMEYMSGGSVHSLLRDASVQVSWPRRWQLAYDCVSAIQQLHSFTPQMVHGNIKSRNFLLCQQRQQHDDKDDDSIDTYTVKVSDVGMSSLKVASQLSTRSSDIRERIKWAAPEVLNQMAYTAMSDIYSVGVLLWDLSMTVSEREWEKPMMDDMNVDVTTLINNIISGYRPSFNADVPIAWRAIAASCWHNDPLERPSASAVLSMIEIAMAKENIKPKPLTLIRRNLARIDNGRTHAVCTLIDRAADEEARLNAHSEGAVSGESRRGFVSFVLQIMNDNMTIHSLQAHCLWMLATPYVLGGGTISNVMIRCGAIDIVTRSVKEHIVHWNTVAVMALLIRKILKDSTCNKQDLRKCIECVVAIIKQHRDEKDISSWSVWFIQLLSYQTQGLSDPDRDELFTYFHEIGGTQFLLCWIIGDCSRVMTKVGVQTLYEFLDYSEFMCSIAAHDGISLLMKYINSDRTKTVTWESMSLLCTLTSYSKYHSISHSYSNADIIDTIISIVTPTPPVHSIQSLCYRILLNLLDVKTVGEKLLDRIGGFDCLMSLIFNEDYQEMHDFHWISTIQILCRLVREQHLRYRILEIGAFEVVMKQIARENVPTDLGFAFMYSMLDDTSDHQSRTVIDQQIAQKVADFLSDPIVTTHAKPQEHLLEYRQRSHCLALGLSADALSVCLACNRCSFSLLSLCRTAFFAQSMTECLTCNLIVDRNRFVCQSCVRTCHVGHELGSTRVFFGASCDCADEKEKSICKLLPPTNRSNIITSQL